MVRAVAGVAGALFLVLGGWVFVDPSSFYARIAVFPPYNAHFLRDIGAFQLGLGAALLVAIRGRDGLLVGLIAGAVGATFHAIGHLVDVGRGGEPIRDLVTLWLLALALIAAMGWRWRELR